MQAGTIITISEKHLNLQPDEFNPKWAHHRKIGKSAEKQIYELVEEWLQYLLTAGESIAASTDKFAPYDFVITHTNGKHSYFDIKTRSEASTTWTCSSKENLFWEKACRTGNNVYVLCGTNLPDNKVRIDGMWAFEDITVIPSKFENAESSCFFNKPSFKNWLLFQ